MGASYQVNDVFASESFEELRRFVARELESPVNGAGSLESFERELRRRMQSLEAQAVKEYVSRYDVDAERVLRPAVLWRKRSFGADSDRGCRYVERMLTAAQSCRLQHRRAYEFLLRSLEAHRTGAVAPSLIRA